MLVTPKRPHELIFSIAIGANYSFELNSIETQAPQFFGHNDSFLGGVLLHQNVREDVSRKLLHCKLLSVFASYLTDGIF